MEIAVKFASHVRFHPKADRSTGGRRNHGFDNTYGRPKPPEAVRRSADPMILPGLGRGLNPPKLKMLQSSAERPIPGALRDGVEGSVRVAVPSSPKTSFTLAANCLRLNGLGRKWMPPSSPRRLRKASSV